MTTDSAVVECSRSSRQVSKPQVWAVADVLALAVVLGWTGYAALGTNVLGKTPWPDTMVDYHLLYDCSRYVVQHKTYPGMYPYPPSAVILHYATTVLPFQVSAAFYLILTMSSALACWWLLLRMLRLDRRPGGLVLVLLALFPSNYFFLWDLKSQNCNLIFLLALLLGAYCIQRKRPQLAGAWLAVSVSLKLFSALLIPYVLWRGFRWVFVWVLLSLGLFWVLLPMLVFGRTGALEVYHHWFQEMKVVSANHADLSHPVLISLHNSAYWLSSRHGIAADLVLKTFRSVWFGLTAVGLARSWLRPVASEDAFGILADVSLLTLGPIAISPYLEPYHPVPFAITAVLLLETASNVRQRGGVRLLALLSFLGCAALVIVPAPLDLRGLMVNLRLLLGTAGVVAVAWLRVPPQAAASTARGVRPAQRREPDHGEQARP